MTAPTCPPHEARAGLARSLDPLLDRAMAVGEARGRAAVPLALALGVLLGVSLMLLIDRLPAVAAALSGPGPV